jgi:Ca-activated chloride channel family protein
VLLLAIPVAVALLVWLDGRRERGAAAWATPALVPNMVRRPSVWRRRIPAALLLVGAAALLVGFARPRASVSVSTQEATIVLVLDVSGSMAADDARPTRLGAAKAVVRQFLAKLPHGYRASLVTFSDGEAVVAPPTHDMTLVDTALERAKTGPQGTALADAVGRAVRVATSVQGSVKGKRPPATIVLLSDGGQTAGRVTPQQAAAAARKAHIPVNSVLVGTPDGVVRQKLVGGYVEQIQVPAQPQTLQAISRLSGGRFLSSPRAVDDKSIYSELGSRVGSRKKTVEVTPALAAGGLVFMLAGGLLSGLWFRRVP